MKKKSTVLILLLALSMIAVLSLNPIAAEPVPKPGIVEWYDEPPGGDKEGEKVHESLLCDPEWLKVYTVTPVHSDTWIIVQGKDCYDQDIEAKALIPKGTDVEKKFPLKDVHSDEEVTFSKITAIFQQGGTHCNSFYIETLPEPFEEYLGNYHEKVGYRPGHPGGSGLPAPPPGMYYHTVGNGITPLLLSYPPEPSNPDPIKIVVNWNDADKDLYFDSGEAGTATGDTTLHIEGIDQCGNKLIVDVPIFKDDKIVSVWQSWSTICKIDDGYINDSYYIFTEPKDQRKIFIYNIRIDHVTLHPDCYNTFAHPNYPIKITVALRDQDGHLVHSADDDTLVNLKTSGGEIRPSCDLRIKKCSPTACAELIPDTNPRNVKVTAIVNVPEAEQHPHMNLISWTEVCFDGVSSVYYTGGWPIDVEQWGYGGAGDTNYPVPQGPFPVPPLPWLPGTPEDEKLNGPIYKVYIPLVPGCNLISTPIHPMLCTKHGWPEGGIPMDILFGKDSSATQTIEAIWTYIDGNWLGYIPGVGYTSAPFTFRDGYGYWVKAEKPCTIVVSGIFMENAPFVPPRYTLRPQSWNLVGVTSLDGIPIKDYLESVNSGDPAYISAAGPVWVYKAKDRAWYRNPSWGLWPTEAFWIFNKVPAPMYIAP